MIGVYAKKYIKAGEELFTKYAYKHSLSIPHDHPWYWEAKTGIGERRAT